MKPAAPIGASGLQQANASYGSLKNNTIALLPGLALTAAIGLVAIGIRSWSGWAALSPLILSIIIGW